MSIDRPEVTGTEMGKVLATGHDEQSEYDNTGLCTECIKLTNPAVITA